MNTVPITASQIRARLDENHLEYVTWQLQDGVTALIATRGGRVFGPFADPDSPSQMWMNPAFQDAGQFRRLLESGAWNVGGDRNWVAPEIQYITLDRSNPDLVAVPPEMDPGQYCLTPHGETGWELRQELMLEARNVAKGSKPLSIQTWLRPVENPLRRLRTFPALMERVRYAGYEQVVTLTDRQPDTIMSELWNLVQLNPGGDLLVGATPEFEIADYATQPIEQDYYRHDGRLMHFRITGDCMYKIGLQSACLGGRVAYLHPGDGNAAALMVRNFFNNPSSIYIEEPAWSPGRWGDSFHVYNDGGRWGGFGELEVHGQTVGGQSGNTFSRDAMQLWFFWGSVERLSRISRILLY
jgi:hypothetical protein